MTTHMTGGDLERIQQEAAQVPEPAQPAEEEYSQTPGRSRSDGMEGFYKKAEELNNQSAQPQSSSLEPFDISQQQRNKLAAEGASLRIYREYKGRIIPRQTVHFSDNPSRNIKGFSNFRPTSDPNLIKVSLERERLGPVDIIVNKSDLQEIKEIVQDGKPDLSTCAELEDPPTILQGDQDSPDLSGLVGHDVAYCDADTGVPRSPFGTDVQVAEDYEQRSTPGMGLG